MVCCSCIALVLIGIAIAVKIYIKLVTKWNKSYTTLIGKTAIVTGANTGIGYYTALDFAKRGARVILACRNKIRAEDAQRRIIKATGNKNVEYKIVDFTSLQSIRNFAENIIKSEDRVDILVNNAGIGLASKNYTENGLPTVLQVNHFSVFLLTHLLIGKLKESAPSRIVNVSSEAASSGKLNIEQINLIPPTKPSLFPDFKLYYDSKLCNILFTIEIAKKLEGSGVTVNALHPGVIYTEIFRDFKGVLRVLLNILGKIYFLTPEEGAQTQIYLAVSKDVEEVTGALFSNCTQIDLYKSANDPDMAKKLWLKSEELVKLTENEKIY